jgi:hypothetical protein
MKPVDAKSNPPLSGQGFQPNKAEENKRGYADDPPGPSRSVKKARTSSTRPLSECLVNNPHPLSYFGFSYPAFRICEKANEAIQAPNQDAQ